MRYIIFRLQMKLFDIAYLILDKIERKIDSADYGTTEQWDRYFNEN